MTTPETPIKYRTACGGEISDPSAYPQATYQGKPVFFCAKACLRLFEQDPDKFMTEDLIHPQDEG
jgi:YHS domain-containing protein